MARESAKELAELYGQLYYHSTPRRNGSPLLAPNRDIYLRENIRSRLLVAAQAVPRHQEETYKQALDNVSTGSRVLRHGRCHDRGIPEDVDKLSQQSITMNVPENLQSRAILEKLMQTRVRNLMAQPAVTQSSAPAPTPLYLHPHLRHKESNAC